MAQTEPEHYENTNITLYPVNLTYALFGRFETLVEFNFWPKDRLILGYHRYSKDWWYGSRPTKGNGFEVQYRRDLDRDLNVIHRYGAYWGTYFEKDWMKYNSLYEDAEINMTRFGLMTGISKHINKNIKLDLYYGVGFNIYTEKSSDQYGQNQPNYYEYSEVFPNGKVGFHIGIKI